MLSAARGPGACARKTVDTARGVGEPQVAAQSQPHELAERPDRSAPSLGLGAGAAVGRRSRSASAHGVTINDVVLAVITNGFRELLLSAASPSRGGSIRTLVPVSVRADDEHGTYNNKVSAMFAELPVEIEDPVERLQSLHEQMQHLKHSGQAVAAERLTALSGFAPAMLLALAGRVGTRLPQSSVNTVTTNVPGPQHPLYLSGRRMLEAFPFVPLGGHVRVGWRSSPTTVGSTSVSPATATPLPTSACCAPASSVASRSCWAVRRPNPASGQPP